MIHHLLLYEKSALPIKLSGECLEAAGSNALPSITGYEPGVRLSEAALNLYGLTL